MISNTAFVAYWLALIDKSDISALPIYLDVRNGGAKCDMASGPCSCGAWHKLGEVRQ